MSAHRPWSGSAWPTTADGGERAKEKGGGGPPSVGAGEAVREVADNGDEAVALLGKAARMAT